MYLKGNENLRKQVIVIDPEIHKKAKLSKEQFLERVYYVKSIRTRYNRNYISFYITSLDEYTNLKHFHDLVNMGKFSFPNVNVFAVAIQPKLYEWFTNTPYRTIEKQIVAWLTAAYYFQPKKRHILQEQLYKPLYEEILELVEVHFREFRLPALEKPYNDISDPQGKIYLSEIKKCNKKYIDFCNKFYKGNPPEFLNSPFDYKNIEEWGVNDHHNFEFIQAYFTEGDWENIVIKGYKDDLKRVESRDDLWDKWKHTYQTFDQRKNFVYSFFFPEKTVNKKQKRETIAQNVKNAVWQRDQGQCVNCGSKEKLEFDHIIPFSKGGSSTYRNIQLLCESCNRKKYINF